MPHVSRFTFYVFIMTLITIRQTGEWGDSPNAAVSFDRRGEYPVTVSDPFSPQEEQQLEWYFEEHLKFPFTGQVKAKQAAESITRYGETLFEQVFKNDFDIYERYGKAKQAGVNALSFEIIGSPEFHQLHWEALKDPKQPNPFVVDAPMVHSTVDPPTHDLSVQESPTINLLLVTARPGGRSDVGYRTISRPLVEGLRQANIPVHIEILRPGTYKALVEHLTEIRDRHGVGYYHIIHFDLHGAVLPYSVLETSDESIASFLYRVQIKNRDCNRGDIETYEGEKAFLFFEGKKEKLFDPAEAEEVSNLLIRHHIPIAILNACQSGKQAGESESNLASRLLLSGVQTVLAMGYSVTVSAAAVMMRTLYNRLFQKNDLSAAIRHARFALFNTKKRRVYYNQHINLEDWLLPVVYQSGEAEKVSMLPLRKFTPEEEEVYDESLSSHYEFPKTAYGFVGRDIDILQIEKRLLSDSAGGRCNLLLIRGMGGAGKTTLLHHLAAWWQTTGFVHEVFYFGYDEKAWTLQQIMGQIARQVFDGQGERPSFEFTKWQALQENAKQSRLTRHLRSARHLLILDNLESITGAQLAIQHTLPLQERDALRGFLADLLDGKTLVLLGSRGGEEWLMQDKNAPLRENDIYDLPGLDPEAASVLAERILEHHVSDSRRRETYQGSEEFRRLLKLLDGYPLPLEIVLANLSRQNPQEILDALQAGDVDLDAKETQSKTESILKCIDYSHSSLSHDAQQLLLCLAPFTGVINIGLIDRYTQQLQQQPALANLPFDRWQDVLQEATNWGLLTPHEVSGYLHLQPIFPYFLRTRLDSPPGRGAGVGFRTAIETAFRQYYNELGNALDILLQSKEPQERQVGQLNTSLEYENLYTALNLALDAQVSILNINAALLHYSKMTQELQRELERNKLIIEKLEHYPQKKLSETQIGLDFISIVGTIGETQLRIRHYSDAEESFQKTLSLIENSKVSDEQLKKAISAAIYHNLGVMATEQRQWGQAELYCQQALAIGIELNNRDSQAKTYFELGRVAEGQQQWGQAELYYQQALAIEIELNDRDSQAKTYHHLGRVAEGQQQWGQAELYYQQCLDLCIEFNDRYSQLGSYFHLGKVMQERRQWGQAELYYQQALAIGIEFNDRYRQAITYGQLGLLAESQEQWAQAQQYSLQALELLYEAGDEYFIEEIMGYLARMWQASKDATLPAAVAAVMGISPQEAEAKLQGE